MFLSTWRSLTVRNRLHTGLCRVRKRILTDSTSLGERQDGQPGNQVEKEEKLEAKEEEEEEKN